MPYKNPTSIGLPKELVEELKAYKDNEDEPWSRVIRDMIDAANETIEREQHD